MGAALEPSDGALEPSLGVNAALSWVTFAGRAGLAFVATTAVARVLGPSGRGEVTYVVNLVGLLVLVVTCGTAAALVRLRVQEGWTAPRMVTPVLRTSVLAGAILIAGAGVALGFASNRTAVIVIAVTALPLVAIANLTQVASLSDRLALVAWTSLAGIGLYAVFTIITAALDVMTVTNNIVAWALTAVLPLPLMLLTGGLVVRNRSLPTDTRRLVRLSLHSNVAAAAVLAIWRADVVIVEARRGFEELGLYSVAVGTAEIVVTLAIGLRSAVLPHQAVAEPERLIDVMCRVTRVAGLGVTLLALVVAATGPWGMAFLFGEEYRSAYPALLWLLPGMVFLVLHYPLFDYVMARGGTRALTIVGVTGVAANVILNLVLLRDHDYTAASIVSTLTYLYVFVACLVLFLRRTGRSVGETLLPRRADLVAVRAQLRPVFSRGARS